MSAFKLTVRIVCAVAVLFAATASSVQAATITFQTTGVFSDPDGNGGVAGNVLTVPNSDIVITFTGVTETVDIPPDWFGSFGTFTVTSTGTAATGNKDYGFTLTVAQVAPPGGPLTFPADYSGNINVNNSTVVVTFSSPLLQSVGTVSYQITTGVLGLPAPTDSPNFADIGGRVFCTDCGEVGDTGSAAAVPEPASLLLLGSGLAAGAARLRRRKK